VWDETPVCDHSNESYWAVLSCCTVYAVPGGSKAYSEDEILACGHSHKSYWDCFYVTLFFTDKVVLTSDETIERCQCYVQQ